MGKAVPSTEDQLPPRATELAWLRLEVVIFVIVFTDGWKLIMRPADARARNAIRREYSIKS